MDAALGAVVEWGVLSASALHDVGRLLQAVAELKGEAHAAGVATRRPSAQHHGAGSRSRSASSLRLSASSTWRTTDPGGSSTSALICRLSTRRSGWSSEMDLPV